MSDNIRMFLLGQIVATPEVIRLTTHEERLAMLRDHQNCRWGDIPLEDRQSNFLAIYNGGRIISSYESEISQRIWVITEADRSVTTMLLPEEY